MPRADDRRIHCVWEVVGVSDYRDVVRLRANGHCERCGRSTVNYPASIHHRRPRGMGGTSDPGINTAENCVLLCGTGTTGCHGIVESHREIAIEEGWLLPRRDPRDPADAPVFAEGAWYLVTADALVPVDLNPPF